MCTLDWNVVVTVYDSEFRRAVALLSRFGKVCPTPYRNVLVMHVGDVIAFLEALQQTLDGDASLANIVSRTIPVTRSFHFDSPEEFADKAQRTVNEWLPDLGGKSFHVRLHRRGLKGKLSSLHEEQHLGQHILERSRSAGPPATVDFDAPDVVIVVETIDQNAGLSCWTRSQLDKFELLRIG